MTTTTRILLFTPYYSENRGNSTTAKRIVAGLEENGFHVQVFAYDEEDWTPALQELADQCDLIHIIHFYRFTKWMDQTNFQLAKPFILTNGGTDVNHDISNQKNRSEMEEIIRKACAITVFTEDAKEKILQAYKGIHLTIEVIKQSVWFPPFSSSEKGKGFSLPPGAPKILLPSGLREVKDVFFLIDELIQLKAKYPLLQFLIAGMVLDENIYETLQNYMKKYEWIRFLENVPVEKMVLLYQWADIVLNTSISEGQSSAILEAMEMGCIVAARHNPGNASMIEDGVNGFLFTDGHEFLEKIEAVLNGNESVDVASMVEQAKLYVQSEHRFESEIAAFMKLYQECLENNN